MRALFCAALTALAVAGPAAAQQLGVPAPGTLFTSAPIEGYPKGYAIAVVLCSEGRHAGQPGLYQIGQPKAAPALDSKKGNMVLKMRLNGQNVYLDVGAREVMWKTFVAPGDAGRVPVKISLLGPVTKPC